MNNRYRSFTLGFLLVLLPLLGKTADKDISIIHKRIVDELMSPKPDDAQVGQLLQTIKEDGTWPGINYEDVSRTGFQHSIHSGNLVLISRAYKTKGSKFYKSKKAKQAVEMALKHWVEKDYFCENWWHNQIGTPNNFVTVMLLVGNELPKELVDKAQPIIGRAHLNASGARPSGDRIKIGGILAKNLLFIGDHKQFDEVIKVIEGEIKFAIGRGMQYDYSFHHREDRVNNTLSYGLGYADAFAEWAAYVAGTKYAFSEEKINQLVDYYLDGICKQMVFGKLSDPGILNRDISRKSGHSSSYGTGILEKLLTTTDYRKDEMEEIIKIRKGEANPTLSFGKFFWQTEHYSHQRPNYFTSVRMFSTRNANMEEPYNGEGLLNHHRADGTNHISISGKEYHNIAPVYDWQKIPGTTVLQKQHLPSENEIQKPGLTDFVGAVTDNLYGSVVFDFKSPHDPLEAKKAWFFFDKEYVCLGAGINARSSLPVATTLNQCHLNGEVVVMADTKISIDKGERELENVKWIFHDRVGYIFLEPTKVQLSNQVQKGNWYTINQQSTTSKEEVALDVFKLWIDHGPRVRNGSYQYIVVPGTSIGEIESHTLNRNIDILMNDTKVQGVKHLGLNLTQAVFYAAGEINLDGTQLTMDSPGLIMVKTDGNSVKKITVADPSRKLRRIHFTLSSKIEKCDDTINSVWNEKAKVSEISILLPQGVYAGKSVTVDL